MIVKDRTFLTADPSARHTAMLSWLVQVTASFGQPGFRAMAVELTRTLQMEVQNSSAELLSFVCCS